MSALDDAATRRGDQQAVVWRRGVKVPGTVVAGRSGSRPSVARRSRPGRAAADRRAVAAHGEELVLLGWLLIAGSAPTGFAAFYRAPGLHLGASLAAGCLSAAVMAGAGVWLLWRGSSRWQRRWAIGCCVAAVSVPFLALATVLLILGTAGS